MDYETWQQDTIFTTHLTLTHYIIFLAVNFSIPIISPSRHMFFCYFASSLVMLKPRVSLKMGLSPTLSETKSLQALVPNLSPE